MAARKKKAGLGRGLGALIAEIPEARVPTHGDAADAVPESIPLGLIHKSPWQPRRAFEEGALAELVQSVREHGVLQPLLVRRLKDEFELIAGERRLRAAHLAQLKEAPAIVMDVTDREALELALIENLQREDLNPIEEADGYQSLMEKFEMTQEEIAQRVGKARATVANALRLLGLSDKVKDLVAAGDLSAGHAKALLGLEIQREQDLMANRAVREGYSVRHVEKLVARTQRGPRRTRSRRADLPESYIDDLVHRLHGHFGTSVRVTPCKTLSTGKKIKWTLEIDYYSSDELDRILDLLGVSEPL